MKVNVRWGDARDKGKGQGRELTGDEVDVCIGALSVVRLAMQCGVNGDVHFQAEGSCTIASTFTRISCSSRGSIFDGTRARTS